MLVTDVYNKAEWEIRGGDDDTEGRARKSEFDQQWDPWPFSLPFFCLLDPSGGDGVGANAD